MTSKFPYAALAVLFTDPKDRSVYAKLAKNHYNQPLDAYAIARANARNLVLDVSRG